MLCFFFFLKFTALGREGLLHSQQEILNLRGFWVEPRVSVNEWFSKRLEHFSSSHADALSDNSERTSLKWEDIYISMQLQHVYININSQLWKQIYKCGFSIYPTSKDWRSFFCWVWHWTKIQFGSSTVHKYGLNDCSPKGKQKHLDQHLVARCSTGH